MSESISEYELKLIRLIDRLDVLTLRYEKLTEHVEKDVATKNDLRICDINIKHLAERIENTQKELTWALRLVFSIMAVGVSTMIIYLIQNIKL